MRLPPALHVTLAPSRRAGALVAGIGAFACLILVLLPGDGALRALAMLLVVTWAIDRVAVIALRRGARATPALWLTGNRLLTVRFGDGRLRAGHVRSASYVGSRITTIVWRPDGARLSQAILILPDMLPAEDFRAVRVMLRYSRNGDRHGAPASHA